MIKTNDDGGDIEPKPNDDDENAQEKQVESATVKRPEEFGGN